MPMIEKTASELSTKIGTKINPKLLALQTNHRLVLARLITRLEAFANEAKPSTPKRKPAASNPPQSPRGPKSPRS